MYIKIMGAVLIVVSSYIFGVYYSKKDKYKSEDLEEIKKGLSVIKDEIMFFSLPLGEAFLKASEKISGGVSAIFSDIGQGIKNNKYETLADVINGAVDKNISETFMEKEDASVLVSLGKMVGDMDSDHQRASIDMALSDIDVGIRLLQEKSEKNEKMYRSLFVLGGILVAVILM